MEIWKDVKNYEEIYKVSDFGRIKSLKFNKEKILKLFKNCSGYYVISLSKNNKQFKERVHRIVYQSFIGELDYNKVIDHIDHNILNNNVNNLQQISHRENLSKDKFRKNPTSKYVGVSWNKNHNKWKSYIYYQKKIIHLGFYDDEEEAKNIYLNKLNELNEK